MLDHVSIPVSDLSRSAEFYDAVLATLHLARRREREGAIGYGPTSRPASVFWILARDDPNASAHPGLGLHISFEASTRREVEAFHATALANGGRDAGRPGPRPQYTQPFFGGFALDPDGYKIEAVCRKRRDCSSRHGRRVRGRHREPSRRALG